MDKIHKKAITQCRSKLVSDISLENELWDQIAEQEIFTPLMLEYIQVKPARPDKVRQLLDKLLRRGPDAYEKFLFCLDNSGHKHLAHIIRQKETALRNPVSEPVLQESRLTGPCNSKSVIYQRVNEGGSGHGHLHHSASAGPLSQQNPLLQILSSHSSPNIAASGAVIASPSNSTQPIQFSVTSPSHESYSNSSQPVQSMLTSPSDELHSNSNHQDNRNDDVPMDNETGATQQSQEPFSNVVNGIQQRNSTSQRERSKKYSMSSNPRGYVLIINNHNFYTTEGSSNHEPVSDLHRRGAKKDQEMLRELFVGFGFGVEIKEDITAEEIEQLLIEFSRYEGLANVDSLIVVLMSHGNNEVILGTDCEKKNVIDLVKLFNADKCQMMMGKPKLFIVNACRGDDVDSSIKLGGTSPFVDKVEFDMGPIPLDRKIPANTDFVIAYSTFPGYASFRDDEQGSWFIECLIEVFRESARDEHIMDLLTMVNERVADKSEAMMGYNQTPAPTTTLRYKWFLNPMSP